MDDNKKTKDDYKFLERRAKSNLKGSNIMFYKRANFNRVFPETKRCFQTQNDKIDKHIRRVMLKNKEFCDEDCFGYGATYPDEKREK